MATAMETSNGSDTPAGNKRLRPYKPLSPEDIRSADIKYDQQLEVLKSRMASVTAVANQEDVTLASLSMRINVLIEAMGWCMSKAKLQDSKIDVLLDTLDSRLGHLESKHDNLQSEVSALKNKLDEIDVSDLANRLANVETSSGKITPLEQKVDDLDVKSRNDAFRQDVASFRQLFEVVRAEKRSTNGLVVYGLTSETASESLHEMEAKIETMPPDIKLAFDEAQIKQVRLIKKGSGVPGPAGRSMHEVTFLNLAGPSKTIFSKETNAWFKSNRLGYQKSKGPLEREVFKALREKVVGVRGANRADKWSYGPCYVLSTLGDYWYDLAEKKVKPMSSEMKAAVFEDD